MSARTEHNRHRVERFLLQSIVETLDNIKHTTKSSARDKLIDLLIHEDFNLQVIK